MDPKETIRRLKSAIGPYQNNCDGYGNTGASGNGYILGFVLGKGVSDGRLSHRGSTVLDEINAFDKAETEDTNIGQINMTIVSSFCGPQGLIWGLDIARHPKLYLNEFKKFKEKNNSTKIYSIKPLLDATKMLFGTVNSKKFPLLPGSHVPCAGKNLKVQGPQKIYAAIALGIPKNRNTSACLLMEDVGFVRKESNKYKEYILENLVKSVIQIGKNQKVIYKEIFLGIKELKVPKNKTGCVLVAAPYFVLARNSIPDKNVKLLCDLNIYEWRESV